MACPATFRDLPISAEGNVERQRQLARILANAPECPVAMPRFGMVLSGISVERSAIVLEFEFPDGKQAHLCLSWPQGAKRLCIERRTTESIAGAFSRAIDAVSARLVAATDAQRWGLAIGAARQSSPLGELEGFDEFRKDCPGLLRQEAIVRTGLRCNQDCRMCWLPRDRRFVAPKQVVLWLEDFRKLGARALTLSGGEPTLDPNLAHYVGVARGLGFDFVMLQTNAVQLARSDQAPRLRAAGVDAALVSLHSSLAAESDAITRAPGTFKRTIAGIHALLGAGIRVALNAVITRINLENLWRLPEFVRCEFGDHPGLGQLNISDASEPFDGGTLRELVPEPSLVRAALPRVIEQSFAQRIPIEGLGMACGPHPCTFEADKRVFPRVEKSTALESRSHLPQCEECAIRSCCLGVRRTQVRLFGSECVRPIRE